jgi:DNA-binding CsgD family transcriptional regulator
VAAGILIFPLLKPTANNLALLWMDERGRESGMRAKNQNSQSLRKRADQLARENLTIAEIGRIISQTYEIGTVYERFAKEARRLIPFDRISINLIQSDEENVIGYTAGLPVRKRKAGDVYPMKGSVMEEVAKSHSGRIIHPKTLGDLKDSYPALLPIFRAGIRSIMVVPLIFRDRLIGDLNFQQKKTKAYNHVHLRLAERICAQIAGTITNSQLFFSCKRAEQELAAKAKTLEEANTALKVLLEKRQKDKQEAEEKVLANVSEVILPLLESLKSTGLSKAQIEQVNLIEKTLQKIFSPLITHLESRGLNLTRKEVQIAHLIREGKTSKEIAHLLGSTERAVDFHRNNIRSKLNLKNQKTRLHAHLSTIPE